MPDAPDVRLRPLQATDLPGLHELFAAMSPLSRRRRFLALPPDPPDDLLRRLVVEVDGIDHVAILATAATPSGTQRVVGAGRIARHPDDPESADLGLAVADDWQHRGVARRMLATLVAQRPPGVVRIRTLVEPGNAAALALLAGAGRMTSRSAGPGALQVQVDDLVVADPTPGPDPLTAGPVA